MKGPGHGQGALGEMAIHVCLILLQGRKNVWKDINPAEPCDEISFG